MEPIAIIGMAAIFPGAANLAAYWSNIVNGVDAIGDVPPARWDPSFYDPTSTAVDRFYCRRGGFIDAYAQFDPLAHGVMPKAAAVTDPEQLLCLRVGSEALADAGYAERAFARESSGIIIGRGNYLTAGTLRLQQHVRTVQQSLQLVRDLLPQLDDHALQRLESGLRAGLDHYGPDVAAGMIPNLVASRLASRLDLGGPAYTVDAACASALLAVEQACRLLAQRQCDLMLAGGVHLTHDLTFWATFCQLGALSRRQQIRPLARDADGILAGEGLGVVVLKRAADAERDGDRIYALIRGAGSASDGRGNGLLAPSVPGQLRALQNAWRGTALYPAQIGLLEAHGTGTPTGDSAELETIRQFFGAGFCGNVDNGAPPPVIGSVKSMIGHAMPAAGIAGLIKAALAVYHGVLPPTLHCDDPHPLLAASGFRTVAATEPWPAAQRVAAVNAFGFGGINAHVVLSEAQTAPAPLHAAAPAQPPAIVVIAAASQAELLERLDRRQWDREPRPGDWRLAIVGPNAERLALARKIVATGKPWQGRRQVFLATAPLLRTGRLACLFPGVDSRFEPRAEDVAAWLGTKLSPHCTPHNPATALMQVVLGVSAFNRFTWDVVRRLGIRPHAVAGHSIGEWSAMAAAGVIAPERAAEIMAQVDIDSILLPDVAFLAAACDRATAAGIIDGLPDLALSHDNCPHQVIVCGRLSAIGKARARLTERHILTQDVPIISGFHTPFFTEYLVPYREFFASEPLAAPHTELWSCTTAQPFPTAIGDQQALAVEHLVSPVQFRQMIENLYAAGHRAFIQLGTGSLTGFVQDTLKGRPHLAISLNSERTSGLEQLCCVAAALWAEGLEFDQRLLFPATSASAEGNTAGSSIRLQLGVPLLRIEQPLAAISAPPPPTLPASGSDPLQALFHDTLNEIRQIDGDIVELWQAHRAADTSTAGTAATRRIRQHLSVTGDTAVVLDHAFYPQRDGWPDIADRHPVVPLTMELCLLRDVIEREFPGRVVIRFEAVRAYNWLVLSQPVDIDITLETIDASTLNARIEGYLDACAVLAPAYPPAPQAAPLALHAARATAIDAEALYRDNWMFHGPAYRGVVQLGPIGDDGICGRLRTPVGPGALLDSMGQLAGYWVMEQPVNCLAMPIGIERIAFYGPAPEPGSEFDCRVAIRTHDAAHCLSDLELCSDDGRVAVAIHGWETRRYAMDRTFWIKTKQPQRHLVSTPLADIDAHGAALVAFVDAYDTALLRDYIARRYLNVPEMATYEQLPPRRRRAWLNGRVAAKDAVRAWLWHHRGNCDLFPKEIRIDNNAHGAPRVHAHITRGCDDNLHVSIAHKHHIAVAAVAAAPVGIDIEAIEPRAPSFLAAACTAAESALLPDTDPAWIARFWTAKEAVAKQRGSGLGGSPRRFEITAVAGERLTIDGTAVHTTCFEGYAIGWTTYERT